MANTKTGSYFCDKCNKSFQLRSSYRVHMDKHKGKRYSCDQCDKTYTAHYSLTVHKRTHDDSKPYKCSVCDARFNQTGHCRRHEKSHSNSGTSNKRGHICDVCENGYGTRSALKRHMEKHAGKEYQCGMCETVCPTRHSLAQHIHTRHGGTFPFKCQLCDAKYVDKHNWMVHQKKHDKNKPVKSTANDKTLKPVIICKVCGHVFSSMNSFRVHKNKHLGIRYFCTRCSKSFTTRDQLKLHERDHDNIRRYQCTECNTAFKRKSNLTRHMHQHEGTRKYVCHICGKAFVLNESLAAHMKVHLVLPSFKCDICGATFKYVGSLKSHQKLHSNNREYKCNICCREFLRKRTLEDHVKVHVKGTGRKALFTAPLEFCSMCSKGFANSYGLRRHMKKHRLGILKNYNRNQRLAVQDKEVISEKEVYNREEEVTRKPKNVIVSVKIDDDGQLFEKVDPRWFMEMEREAIPKYGNQISPVDDISLGVAKLYDANDDELGGNILENEDDNAENDLETLGEHSDFDKTDDSRVTQNVLNEEQAKKRINDSSLSESDEDTDEYDANDVDMWNKTAEDMHGLQGAYRENEFTKMSTLYNAVTATENDEEHESVVTLEFEENEHKFSTTPSAVSDIVDNLYPNAKSTENREESHESKDKSISESVKDSIRLMINLKKIKCDKQQSVTSEEVIENSDDSMNTTERAVDEFDGDADDDFADESGCCENNVNETVLVCHYCTPEKSFSTKNRLRMHLKQQHKFHKFPCLECYTVFIFKTDYEHHVKTHGKSNMLKCSVCCVLFKTARTLKRHIVAFHKDNIRAYHCTNCRRTFFSKYAYEKHMNVCNKAVADLECMFCLTKYASLNSWKMHLKRYHRDSDDKIYKCDKCSKLFASSVLYRNHVDTHIYGGVKTKERCECEICGAEFFSTCSLRRHKRVIHYIDEKMDEHYTIEEKRHDTNGEEVVEEEANITQIEQNVCSYNEELALQEILPENIVKAHIEKRTENLNLAGNYHIYEDSIGTLELEKRENIEDANKGVVQENKSCKANIESQQSERDATTDLAVGETIKASYNRTVIEKGERFVKQKRGTRFQRKFRCTKCHKSFHMMSTLKRHMSGHENNDGDSKKILVCNHCDERFNTRTQLLIHERIIHNAYTYHCRLCPKKFSTLSHLKRHNAVHHTDNTAIDGTCSTDDKPTDETRNALDNADNGGDKPYMCGTCGMFFTASHSLTKHMLVHSGDRPYACPMCQATFIQAGHLKRHREAVHDGVRNVPCSFDGCDKTFSSHANMLVHTRYHKNERPYKCSQCSASFIQSGHLSRHFKMRHFSFGQKKVSVTSLRPGKERSEMCEKCGQTFHGYPQLSAHLRRNQCERSCQYCNAGFPTQKRLERHLRDNHNVYAHSCNVCLKEFSCLSNLKRHKSIHHFNDVDSDSLSRNFMCNQCGKCFTARDSLRVHMFIHTGERPYKCTRCDAAYTQSGHLLRHVKSTHLGQMDYRCTYDGCAKKFYDLSCLHVHIRCHTNERPYACKECGKGFRTLSTMKTHLRTHSLSKRFECYICFQGITTKHCLERHLARHGAAEKLNPQSALYDPNFRAKIRQRVVKKMEEKKFACLLCAHKFTTTRGLYAHQRKYCKQYF